MLSFLYFQLTCQDKLRVKLPPNVPSDTKLDGVYSKTKTFVSCQNRPDVALYTRTVDNTQYDLFFCEEPPPVISQYFVTLQNNIVNQTTSFMNVRNLPISLLYCEVANLNLYYNCSDVDTCPAENIYGNVIIENESDDPQIINLSTSDILKIVLPIVLSWLALWVVKVYCLQKGKEENEAKQPLNVQDVVNLVPRSKRPPGVPLRNLRTDI